ncbi:hypothetical protein OQA88_13489 [Cercophora sp. LCS_1]
MDDDQHSSRATPSEPEWLRTLESRIQAGDADDNVEAQILSIAQRYLTNNWASPLSTAMRYATLYEEVYVPKFDGLGGRPKFRLGYVRLLCNILIGVGVSIGWDHPAQARMVQLLEKMMHLYRTSYLKLEDEVRRYTEFVSGNVLFFIYVLEADEPFSPMECFDQEVANQRESGENDLGPMLNFNAFRARCLGADLGEGSASLFTNAAAVISKALDAAPHGNEQICDVHILAAAHYFVHAARAIHDHCLRNELPARTTHPRGQNDRVRSEVWKRWGLKLREMFKALHDGEYPGFEVREESGEAVKRLVGRSWHRMLALEPDLFPHREGEHDFVDLAFEGEIQELEAEDDSFAVQESDEEEGWVSGG